MNLRSPILSLATVASLLATAPLHAQDPKHCGTDEARRSLIAEDPGLLHKEAQAELGLQEYLQARAGQRDDGDSAVYTLPIVFHILYDPVSDPSSPMPASDVHNISDSQVFDEMNILNRDYNLENPDTNIVVDAFKHKEGNIRVHFQLATRDPLGNCTNGIDRVTTLRSTNAGDYAKVNDWFRDRYINVWVINTFAQEGSGFEPAGYSQLPPDVQSDAGALRDGVILLHNYLGSIGTSSPFTSRTLTHELGHYLNLEHTWGSTNSPEVSCGDDGVEDTPITKGHLSCNPHDLADYFCSSQLMDTVYTFADISTSSGTTDPTAAPTVYLNDTLYPALTLSPFTATGVSPNSAEDGHFAFTQWDGGAMQGDSTYSQLTGQLNPSHYYEFTVTPTTPMAMALTGLTFSVERSGTGPRTFAVRSSVNNYATNLTASVIPVDTALSLQGTNVFYFTHDTTGSVPGCTISVNYADLTSPVTFRIYAWNAEDAAGSFALNDVTVHGNFGIVENTQNYMEYSYCTHMFTMGQAERMRATLNSPISSRNNLWTDGNHVSAGIAGNELTCGPSANFYTLTPFVCVNTPVQFKDNSGRATPTSWAWTFEGGNPATSTDQNPTVTFADAGAHAVTLTSGNDNGSSTFSKWDAVHIGPNYSEVGALLNEPFNGAGSFPKWTSVNWDSNSSSWSWSNAAGHDGPGCAMLNSSLTYDKVQDIFDQAGGFADKDLLVSPMLDLRSLSNIQLTFWYSYSSRSATPSDITEKLKVWSTTDCGEHWLVRKTIAGTALVTAGVQNIGYVPTSGDWQQVTVTLPSILATNNVRLAFEYTSGLLSNDIYVDDISINGSNVGIDELAQSGGMGLMPNPANDRLTVTLDLASSTSGTLSFLDMTGRTIYEQAVTSGQKQLDLDLHQIGLSSGVYLVRLKHASGQRVERLVVR